MSIVTMTQAEREAFLAEARIGIISIASHKPDRAPLAVPIWYDYDPAIGVWVITEPRSRKGKALHAAGRYTLTVQVESFPHQYVSVEGPVVEERPTDKERDLRPMAHRYNDDPKAADAYTDSYPDQIGHVYVMRPEHWLSVDQ